MHGDASHCVAPAEKLGGVRGAKPKIQVKEVSCVYDTTTEATSKDRSVSGVKRLSLNLSVGTFEELKRISQDLGTSMKEVLRLALGLVKIAVEENKRGNKLVIVSQGGEQLKEILLPH